MKFKVVVSAVECNLVASGRFPKSAKGALIESIKKWQCLVRFLASRKAAPSPLPPFFDGGPTTCACCNLFNDLNEPLCLDCPVQKFSGFAACDMTPYEEWETASSQFNEGDMLNAARAEVKFLKRVLRNLDQL